MNVEEYKKYAIPKIEAGKMVKVIRQALKSVQYSKQDQDEKQKEIYKPIVQQLEKEAEDISKLREVLTPTKEEQEALPAPQQEALPAPQQEALPESQIVDLDADFTPKELATLEKYKLALPSKVYKTSIKDDGWVNQALMNSGKLNQSLGRSKGGLNEGAERDGLSEDIKIIRKYRNRLKIIEEGKKTIKKGSGIKNKYFQPKRNAYKIKEDGQYGNLKIDVPQLLGHLKLVAYKDGKKVYDKNVDFDTIDLLTKRFNSRKKYSTLSQNIFDKLNKLSGIPIHKSSKKYSKLGSGVLYFKNPNDLLDRLELLSGEINAGNDSSDIKNEFSEIAHTLRLLNIISDDHLKKLLKEYLL